MKACAAFLIAVALVACHDTNVAQQTSATTEAVLHIEGMTCGGCETGVQIALEKLPGVQEAEVSYEKSQALVTYDPDRVNVQEMKAAVESLGYQAKLDQGKVES